MRWRRGCSRQYVSNKVGTILENSFEGGSILNKK